MARPRIHEPGTTATQRVTASRDALVAAGGARKEFRLSPAAVDAMRSLMSAPNAPGNETALIERLLLEEKSRTLGSCAVPHVKQSSTTKIG